MRGLFISFEGTEGSGKSSQLRWLAERLERDGHKVCVIREPGGTPIGEEIRHTLKHSDVNQAMTPEAELLLINASRAQLVREVIEPALKRGEIVLADRFFDSTVAYQGYGRQLDLGVVQQIIDFAVGGVSPHLTLLLKVSVAVSEDRRRRRGQKEGEIRDRMEEADRAFFERVERGYEAVARGNPDRVHVIEGGRSKEEVRELIWAEVRGVLERHGAGQGQGISTCR